MSNTLARTFVRGKNGGFGSKQTPEQAIERARLEKELNAEAAANWDNPVWHRQLAQDLSEMLTYGFTTSANPFGDYIATKTIGEFDREIITERRGLSAYFTARGGHVDVSQLRTENWTVERDNLAFHLVEFADNIRANFASVFADIATLAEARLRAEQWRRFLQLAQAAVPSGSPYYSTGAGVDEATLKAALQSVQEAVRPDGVAESPITIIGRAPMINQILDFAGYAPNILEEIQRTNLLGFWRGAQITVLRNYVDENGTSYMPANELWVLGGNAGRFINFGGVRVNSWVDDELEYQHTVGRCVIGAVITHPEMTHRVIDSSISA